MVTKNWDWKKWGDPDQRVQTPIYKMSKFYGFNVHRGDYS